MQNAFTSEEETTMSMKQRGKNREDKGDEKENRKVAQVPGIAKLVNT